MKDRMEEKNKKKNNIVSHICSGCGKTFEGKIYRIFCDECLKKSKSESTYRERICLDCGCTFWGYPKQKRCPECAVERAKNLKRIRKERNSVRHIGSIDKCPICGSEYAVSSSVQKYCSKKCAKIGYDIYNKTVKTMQAMENYKKLKEMEKERNSNKKFVCKYCKAEFISKGGYSPYCSIYCRKMAEELNNSVKNEDDPKGYEVEKLLEKREEYRKLKREEKESRG